MNYNTTGDTFTHQHTSIIVTSQGFKKRRYAHAENRSE
jgi:hypothetical protein